MGDTRCGMYPKFQVSRIDGSSEPGKKHEHCRYFVIDLKHDLHAAPALEAYASACEQMYPLLAADLRRLLAGEDVPGLWDKDQPQRPA